MYNRLGCHFWVRGMTRLRAGGRVGGLGPWFPGALAGDPQPFICTPAPNLQAFLRALEDILALTRPWVCLLRGLLLEGIGHRCGN